MVLRGKYCASFFPWWACILWLHGLVHLTELILRKREQYLSSCWSSSYFWHCSCLTVPFHVPFFFFLMFQEINNVFIYLVHSFLVFLKFLNSLLSAQQCLGIILQNYAYQNALLNLLHSGVPGSLSQESVRFLDLWWWVQAPLWT